MDRTGFQKLSRRTESEGSACIAWAMLLPDAADGLLSEAEQRALDRHLAGCAACKEELAEAQRGLAWLTVLKEQSPEPPVNLLASILAQTTGAGGPAEQPVADVPAFAPVMGSYAPATHRGSELPGQTGQRLRSWLGLGEGSWSTLTHPRLAMTGAMAFFSICLTLNLTGFSVRELNSQNFRKGGLHRTVAETSASVVRSIESMRVVYRVESRVNEMRAQNDSSLDSDPNR